MVRHHNIKLAGRNVCKGIEGQKCSVASARYLAVMRRSCGSPPEASGWKCRTDEAPPMVMSWAQSSAGFSKTRRIRRALNGVLRGCLVEDKSDHLCRRRPTTGGFSQLHQRVFKSKVKATSTFTHEMKPGHQLTILQWHHRVQCQRATGSSCS